MRRHRAPAAGPPGTRDHALNALVTLVEFRIRSPDAIHLLHTSVVLEILVPGRTRYALHPPSFDASLMIAAGELEASQPACTRNNRFLRSRFGEAECSSISLVTEDEMPVCPGYETNPYDRDLIEAPCRLVLLQSS